MALQLTTVNSGPFRMYRVLDLAKRPARVLMTTADENEAKDYIAREVEDRQWRASNGR